MGVVGEGALLGILDQIYESIERPELWPETIYAIGGLIGGRRHFWGLDQNVQPSEIDLMRQPNPLEIGCYGTVFLSHMDLQALDEYAQEFGALLIRFIRLVFLSILRSQSNVGAREAIGLKMAQRYLRAFEPLDGTSASECNAAGRNLIAALWEDGRVFSADNLQAMRLLAPHLDRALRLQMRLSSADVRAGILSGALDCLTHGVMLVDRSGLPLWLNRRAREIMEASSALRLSSAGFVGHRPADTRSLRELIKDALSAGKQGLVAIADHDSRPLLVTAIPLNPTDTSDGFNAVAHAAVFISDPDRANDPTVETLRRAFRLTRREAETAIAIAQGHGLQAAADTMGVALTTARSQLQQVFAKTGTNHQAELTALLHRTLTHLRYDMSQTDGTPLGPTKW
jgi:DNA-binding CsgD family transcriptional regulator/PAS domain-containing protein